MLSWAALSVRDDLGNRGYKRVHGWEGKLPMVQQLDWSVGFSDLYKAFRYETLIWNISNKYMCWYRCVVHRKLLQLYWCFLATFRLPCLPVQDYKNHKVCHFLSALLTVWGFTTNDENILFSHFVHPYHSRQKSPFTITISVRTRSSS